MFQLGIINRSLHHGGFTGIVIDKLVKSEFETSDVKLASISYRHNFPRVLTFETVQHILTQRNAVFKDVGAKAKLWGFLTSLLIIQNYVYLCGCFIEITVVTADTHTKLYLMKHNAVLQI